MHVNRTDVFNPFRLVWNRLIGSWSLPMKSKLSMLCGKLTDEWINYNCTSVTTSSSCVHMCVRACVCVWACLYKRLVHIPSCSTFAVEFSSVVFRLLSPIFFFLFSTVIGVLAELPKSQQPVLQQHLQSFICSGKTSIFFVRACASVSLKALME